VKDSSHRCNSAHFKPEAHHAATQEKNMLGTILLVLLILVLIGALPTWPHSRNWGYYPSSGIGFVVLVVVVLLLIGRI
jgi:hypothetical protein